MSDRIDDLHATVLVVDDEAGPRESLRMILAPQHRVLQAPTGAAALELLAREPVELMTVDLNMPGMNGQDLMRTVRSEFPMTEVIVITGCGSVESAAEGIRAGISDYLQKPFDVVQVTAAVVRTLKRQHARARLAGFLEELGRVVGRDREAEAILEDVQQSRGLQRRLGEILEERGSLDLNGRDEAPRTIEFLEVLAETIETKDRFMRGHARRVALFGSLIAERLGLGPEEREQVRIAAFLHDLGKVGVPTDLLLRAGALEPAERALVEKHPEIGARLLSPLGIPGPIEMAIRHHHEWWDGTGYPDGLAREEIPQIARIVSVADAFDAMSCDRPYRAALNQERVMDELRRFAGIQFDPELVKELLALIEVGATEAGSEASDVLLAQSPPAVRAAEL